MSSEKAVDNRAKLSPKWQRRFEVYDENGSWEGFAQTESYKKLSFWERASVNFNVWAFFFGIIYYIVIGIPKRAIGIFFVSMLLIMFLYQFDAPDKFYKYVGFASSVYFATFANYFYYIKVTKGRDSFDPLKDVRKVD